MNSSMSCVARFFDCARSPVSASPSKTALALPAHRLGDLVLHAELICDAGHGLDRRGGRSDQRR